MIIDPNKRYVLGNGDIVGPFTVDSDGDLCPYQGKHTDKVWKPNGKKWSAGYPTYGPEFDIVAEYIPKSAASAKLPKKSPPEPTIKRTMWALVDKEDGSIVRVCASRSFARDNQYEHINDCKVRKCTVTLWKGRAGRG